MPVSVPRYSIADLERFPNDGNRYELLDGVLLVAPAPSHAHQIIVNRLQLRLMEAVVIPAKGQVVGPGAIAVPPKRNCNPTYSSTPTAIPSIRSGRISTSTGSRSRC
jgi:hypothetical protein